MCLVLAVILWQCVAKQTVACREQDLHLSGNCSNNSASLPSCTCYVKVLELGSGPYAEGYLPDIPVTVTVKQTLLRYVHVAHWLPVTGRINLSF